MFGAESLTFQEFAMREELPLAAIQNGVLEFLQNRNDAVLIGAQAVNAYVSEPRMTQDIDVVSHRAADLAQEMRDYMSKRFQIAVRVRQVGKGKGYRIFQVRKTGNRHLVDLRSSDKLPIARQISKVLVAEPAELIAAKVISYHQRRGKPKSGTDWRDLALLLLKFPELKQDPGAVAERLKAAGASSQVLEVWKKLVSTKIQAPDDDDEF